MIVYLLQCLYILFPKLLQITTVKHYFNQQLYQACKQQNLLMISLGQPSGTLENMSAKFACPQINIISE